MRLFIKNFIIFSSIILVLNMGFYFITYYKYYKTYTPEIKYANYHSYLFADSYGISLKNYLDKAGIYNFSAGSDTYVDIYRKFSYLIDNNINIKTIYIPADEEALSHYKDDFNNLSRSIYYTNYEAYKKTSQKTNYISFIIDKFLTYYFVFLNGESQWVVKNFINSSSLRTLHLTKEEKKINWVDINNKDERTKRRFQTQFGDTIKSILMETCLKEIILLCKSKNIIVVGVKFPYTSSYIKITGTKTFGVQNIFFQNNIKILDFKSIFEGKDELFSDPDHLNDKGGEVFSEQLLLKL